ncbi:hypothetical protein KUTeg_005517 [Tegillarca granosa]|uniref:LRRNT domain-containing protein n=1 Tax=Tegillarca granosa TaxID=220873 RepID=A0ABQ9FJY6_TEGGR|nr:hypothetical protein KUTeg_005517 [Tegillarca granosa]
MKFVFWIILVFVTWNYSYIQKITACPPGCTCTTLKPKDGKGGDSPRIGRGRKVNCVNNHPPISTVSQINSIPLDTVILDLSKNAITILRKGGFDRLSMLKKL